MRPAVLFPAIALLALLIALGGCRPAECQQMLECCEQAEDLDGVGAACDGLADDTRNPQTCTDVTRTVGYMFEDRDESVPQACRL